GHLGGVSAISLASQDGMILVSGGRDGEVHFWDLTSIGSNSLKDLRASGAKIESITVSPDFKLLAAGDAMGTLSVWNLDGYKLLFSVIAHRLEVTAVAFTSSSLCLYSGSRDGTIQKWD
ncbi:WD40-repeat-containing domain protein, partial [Lasiosphaeria miniovina]